MLSKVILSEFIFNGNSFNSKVIFSVQTHPRTKYQDYLRVLDQLKEAKATKISIANPPIF